MNEQQANSVAEALGGEAWNSGGGIWLVVIKRSDGRLVVISDDAVCEYADEQAFENSRADAAVVLH